eukprot:COSAG01_NODE_741_length_13888_cov_119.430996_6_plen_251_part_00
MCCVWSSRVPVPVLDLASTVLGHSSTVQYPPSQKESKGTSRGHSGGLAPPRGTALKPPPPPATCAACAGTATQSAGSQHRNEILIPEPRALHFSRVLIGCTNNFRTDKPEDFRLVRPSENRLSSRSKFAKVERARFWVYSEIYCVGVRERARLVRAARSGVGGELDGPIRGHRTPGQGQAQSKDHHQAVVQARVGTTPSMTEPFTNRLGYAGCSQPQMVDPGITSRSQQRGQFSQTISNAVNIGQININK